MDIRNWGQTFMARIKQLPSQATGFAHDLPNALNDLPKTLEDGAKAVIVNDQVAEGWKTVGQGVGQLTGWKSSDQVNLSDAAKSASKPEVPTATPDVPNPEPATDPVGHAVQDAASTTPKGTLPAAGPAPAEPPPTVAPDTAPAVKPAAPAADPIGKAVQGAATDSPASTLTKTVRRARTAKAATRVADGARAAKAAAEAKPVAVEGPLSLSRLEAKPSFNNSALELTDRASLMRQMGHPAEAKTLSQFADKLQKAGTFYDKNQKLISGRMLHAKGPLGLNNPELQAALKTSSKASEVGSAFGVKAESQPFSNAARRMYARAEQLDQLGHPAEAAKLTKFADRLSTASEQAAKGHEAAAFKLFRRGFNPETQQAIQVSNKANEVYTAFSQEPQAAKAAGTAGRAAKAAGQAGGATKAIDAGRTAATASRVAKGAKAVRAGKAVTQAGQEASTVAHAGRAAKGAKAALAAEHAGEARGFMNAGEAAKGAKQVAGAAQEAGSAAKGAGAAGEAANAAKGATTAADAANGAAVAGDAAKAADAGAGAAHGVIGGIKGFFGKIGGGIKGFFGKFGKGTGGSGGWSTIKAGFAKMLPGLGKAIKSSAIFSAVFSIGSNLFDVLRGKKTIALAVGTVFGDTLGGAIGGVVSALASGAAIAALGALGVVGLPLTLAAGAVGILGFMGFDHLFRNSSIYDTITHLFT